MDRDTIWETSPEADAGEPDEPLQPPPWDDDEHRSMRCRRCQLPRVFRKRKTRHSLHFMLSIGTIGIWLPAWGLAIILQWLKPWTCTVCGDHQRDS